MQTYFHSIPLFPPVCLWQAGAHVTLRSLCIVYKTVKSGAHPVTGTGRPGLFLKKGLSVTLFVLGEKKKKITHISDFIQLEPKKQTKKLNVLNISSIFTVSSTSRCNLSQYRGMNQNTTSTADYKSTWCDSRSNFLCSWGDVLSRHHVSHSSAPKYKTCLTGQT